MMLYKNMKVMVYLPDGDTEFFDIVVRVLQRGILALYMFIICLDYVLCMLIDLIRDNGFTLKKTRSRKYPTETTTDADNADDRTLLATTPAQAKSLLYSLMQAAGGIDVNMKTDKTEFMLFKQDKAIFTIRDKLLKLVDQFTYIGSNISSTESDVNIHIGKAWTTIDRLLIIWKPDIIKQDIFQAVAGLLQLYGCTTWTLMPRKVFLIWYKSLYCNHLTAGLWPQSKSELPYSLSF